MKTLEIISRARLYGEHSIVNIKFCGDNMIGSEYIADLTISDQHLNIKNKAYIEQDKVKEFENFLRSRKIGSIELSEYLDGQFTSNLSRNKHNTLKYSYNFRYFFHNDLVSKISISAKKLVINSIKIDNIHVYGEKSKG